MKRTIISFILSVWICILVLPDVTFAESEFMRWLFDKLDFLIRLLWWLWVVPATVAGKLLTNQYVFWEFLWLNTYLRKIRQIMRNFANFTVWVLFLWYLIQAIINAGSTADLWKNIVKLCIAWILLNASRFLMKVMVDLSIVATVAVAGMPIWILEKTRDQQRYTNLVLAEYNIVDGLNQSSKNNNTKTNEVTLESITPDSNNMAGPIVYMWTAILWFLTSDFLPYTWRNAETLLLLTSLKVIILILFTMPLLVLLVTNMLRIFWIWVRIVFSPFLAIYFVLWDTAPSGMKSLASSLRAEWLGNLMWLIFQPMVVVWALWVWLILITSITRMMSGWSEYARMAAIWDMQIYHTPHTTMVWETASVTVKGWLFKEVQYRAFWFFWDVILSFFVIFLLRWMVKAWSSFSSVTESVSNSMFSFWKNLAMSIPIVPMMWGQWIWSLTNNAWKLVKNATGVWAFEAQMKKDSREFYSKINKKLGWVDPDKQSISWDNLDELSGMTTGDSGEYRKKYSEFTNEKKDEGLLYKSHVKSAAKQFFTNSPKVWVDRLRAKYWDGLFRNIYSELGTDWYSFAKFEKTGYFQNFMRKVSQWKLDASELISASNNSAQVTWFVWWSNLMK